MPIALRPRSTASTITSSNGAHALARPAVPRAATDSESVIASLAGFGPGPFSESVIASLAGFGRPHRPGRSNRHPGGPQVRARRLPTNARRLLDPPKTPAEATQCFDLLLLLFAQDVGHPGRGGPDPLAPVNVPLTSPLAGFDSISYGRF